jgi:hypothetical protein
MIWSKTTRINTMGIAGLNLWRATGTTLSKNLLARASPIYALHYAVMGENLYLPKMPTLAFDLFL